MQGRRIGQETEYAIRFSPADGRNHPGNQEIFHALRRGIRKIVQARPGQENAFQERYFIQNGGSFNYEHQPYAPDGGLIECATPECSGPNELLVYQRAQEELLVRAVPEAERYLRRRGHAGELALLKNCRDAEGHIYGTQENYETRLADGWRLHLFRLALPTFVPPVLLAWGAYWSTIVCVFVLVGLFFAIAFALSGIGSLALLYLAGFFPSPGWIAMSDRLRLFRKSLPDSLDARLNDRRVQVMLARIEYHVFHPLWNVVLVPYSILLRITAFVPRRRDLLPFLASRVILSGAGCLLPDDRFALSEKATAVRKTTRLTVGPEQRPIFDFGNLYKALIFATIDLFWGRTDALRRMFGENARMQLGMADANRCQVAEFIKVGSTQLVLEMSEAGWLEGGPRLPRPIRACRSLNFDPGGQVRVPVRLDGQTLDWNIFELQGFYLSRAEKYVHSAPRINAEFFEVVRLWRECLDSLKEDPGRLIGRLDWVTKRYLLESARDEPYVVRKKIDLAYHELGTGYYDRLEEAGVAVRLVQPEECERAIFEPPTNESARLRSRLIRDVRYAGKRMRVSWSSVQIGTGFDRRVVSLDDFRARR